MVVDTTRSSVRIYAFEGGADPVAARVAFEKANAGALIQTFDMAAASNGFFVQMIAAQTLRAALSGGLLAKKPEMDFLLRLAGTSQISEAISRVGTKRGEPFGLVVAAASPGITDKPPLRCRALPRLALTEAELGRVEKAALLGARRT
jgi:tRNA threonylcarbamoyladenosine modification (KEOPS) complex Cgi121 subunit